MAQLAIEHPQGTLHVTLPNDAVLEDRVCRLAKDFARAGGSWFANGVDDEVLPSRMVWIPASSLIEAVFDRGVPLALDDLCEDVDVEGMVRGVVEAALSRPTAG